MRFCAPERFDLHYIGEDAEYGRYAHGDPGSLERFTAPIEHLEGATALAFSDPGHHNTYLRKGHKLRKKSGEDVQKCIRASLTTGTRPAEEVRDAE